MNNSDNRLNIHDFANALLKLPKYTNIILNNGEHYVRSFGVYASIFENDPNSEATLELIKKGLLGEYSVVINPNNFDVSNGHVELK